MAALSTANPPNPLKLPQARTILLVFALTFPLLPALHQVAKSHRSTQAAWSRCIRLALDKDTRVTHLTDTATRCANVSQRRGRQKYTLARSSSSTAPTSSSTVSATMTYSSSRSASLKIDHEVHLLNSTFTSLPSPTTLTTNLGGQRNMLNTLVNTLTSRLL